MKNRLMKPNFLRKPLRKSFHFGILVFLISLPLVGFAEVPSLTDSLQQLVDSHKPSEAIELLEQQTSAGDRNPVNFLSLAILNYDVGNLGKARLNIERAILLKPNDPTILAFAEQITDRIASDFVAISPSPFIEVVRTVRNSLMPTGWLVLNVISVLFLFLGTAQRLRFNMPGGHFFSTVTAFTFFGFLFILSLSLGISRQLNITNNKSVVAMDSGSLHISASGASPEGRTFKAGDVFGKIESQGSWIKVMTSELEEYWVDTTFIQDISL